MALGAPSSIDGIRRTERAGGAGGRGGRLRAVDRYGVGRCRRVEGGLPLPQPPRRPAYRCAASSMGGCLMATAVVVGSGPNGLAGAVRLARHGIDVEVLEAADRIGGGTRSSELTVPGVVHDHCSAFHPMGVGSPFLSALGLEHHGPRWRWPEIDCAHPGHGRAGLLWRSVDETAEASGPTAVAAAVFAGLAAGFDDLADDLMRPIVHLPRHPLRLLRFGTPALLPAAVTARVWRTGKARALFGGSPPTRSTRCTADHLGHRDDHHRRRAPPRLARGRGRLPVDRRRPRLAAPTARRQDPHRGGVRTARDIPPADVVLLDLAPGRSRILGDQMPSGVARFYRRYRHGPARSSSTSPSRAIRRGRTPHVVAPAPSTWAAPSRRSPAPSAPSHRGACPAALRPRRPAVPRRPHTIGREHQSDLDLRPRAARLHRRRHRGHPGPDRALRPPAPATASWPEPRGRRPSLPSATRTTSAATSSRAPTPNGRS